MIQSPAYLVDTNVVSETRKKCPDENVVRFFAAQPGPSLYLSVLTLGELRRGVASKARADASGAAELERWVNQIETTYTNRLLEVDLASATLWGKPSAARTLPVIDTFSPRPRSITG